MNASDNEATFVLAGDSVVYTEHGIEIWRASLPRLAVVGEYTTTDGPYVDDYFLVFITLPERHHFHGSFYAEGREALLAALSQRFWRSGRVRFMQLHSIDQPLHVASELSEPSTVSIHATSERWRLGSCPSSGFARPCI